MMDGTSYVLLYNRTTQSPQSTVWVEKIPPTVFWNFFPNVGNF